MAGYQQAATSSTYKEDKDMMKSKVGLWIDRQTAILVSIGEDGEVIKQVNSHVEEHTQSPVSGSQDAGERKMETHLNKYYDVIIDQLGDADVVQIFGPGEAKHELKSRIEASSFQGQTL